MSNKSLFRSAALDARNVSWLGEIVLMRPLSFSMITLFTGAATIAIIIFLFFGTYTKRASVRGHLVPTGGLIKVYPSQAGIIYGKSVHEGQTVSKGDVLYVISSERLDSVGKEVQANVSSRVTERRKSLKEELDKTRLLHTDEYKTLVGRIASLQLEMEKLKNQVDGQNSRVRLAEATVERYSRLAANEYVSKEAYQQKTEELLDQQSVLRTQERDKLILTRELNTQNAELVGMKLRHHNQLAQLERSIAGLDQELTESEGKRRIQIVAPAAGTVTAVGATLGQAVDGGRPLLNIVPAGAMMHAYLYAPSNAIGFVKAGQPVFLRYEAYPYQKFGHAVGEIESISRTAIPENELTSNLLGTTARNESLYRITVKLNAQTHLAYGKSQALQAGMLLNADIMQEKRRLYEWVLDPLYSITGKL